LRTAAPRSPIRSRCGPMRLALNGVTALSRSAKLSWCARSASLGVRRHGVQSPMQEDAELGAGAPGRRMVMVADRFPPGLEWPWRQRRRWPASRAAPSRHSRTGSTRHAAAIGFGEWVSAGGQGAGQQDEQCLHPDRMALIDPSSIHENAAAGLLRGALLKRLTI
jgi:hypothetical protein